MADTTFLAPDNSVPMGVLPYLNNNGGLFGDCCKKGIVIDWESYC